MQERDALVGHPKAMVENGVDHCEMDGCHNFAA